MYVLTCMYAHSRVCLFLGSTSLQARMKREILGWASTKFPLTQS